MTELKMRLNAASKLSHINREIYGSFSEHLGRCIYGGLYAGLGSEIPNLNGVRKDVCEALKQLRLPVLRWPGGCFADEYHWQDGIGPLEQRKRMINTHWGGVVEDNSFGTHEFFELCSQLGCEPYITANVGSGSVREMSEWIEYITFDGDSPMARLRQQNGRKEPWHLKYLNIGNENWGCGGNMRPEYYADEYRRYATYCREYNGNRLFKIACGPNSGDYDWTEKLMSALQPHNASAISLHYYTGTDGRLATDYNEEQFYETMKRTSVMDELIVNHRRIMDKYDPQRRISIAVDEWGTWHAVEPNTNPGFLFQQSTMRDAFVAARNLDIFNRRSGIVCMANIAQTVNVLQAVVLTEGAKMLKTPTYHVFDMYKGHQGAELIESASENLTVPAGNGQVALLSHSASVAANGEVNLTLSNCSVDRPLQIKCSLSGAEFGSVSGRILTGGFREINTFDDAECVSTKPFEGAAVKESILTVELPAYSVVSLCLR